MEKNIELNQIYFGDCLEVMKNIPDNSIDMILTDPPYGINFRSNLSKNHDYIENDDFDTWLSLLPMWLSEMQRVITPSGVCCLFCAGGGGIPVTPILTMEAKKYFHLIQTLVWVKRLGLGWKYRSSYENILVLSKSKTKYAFYDTSRKCSNVIMGITNVIPRADMHPTQKPVNLMKHLLRIHSQENDIVLDPFAGSGTTAVACIELNRRFIAIEKNEKYYQMAKDRMEKS